MSRGNNSLFLGFHGQVSLGAIAIDSQGAPDFYENGYVDNMAFISEAHTA